MKNTKCYCSFLRNFLLGSFFFLVSSAAIAQVSSLLTEQTNALPWKDRASIEQIIQQELIKTEASLQLPDLTDWSTAMLEAYRSLLIFTQTEMQVKQDMQGALDEAFTLMQTEAVQHPASRAMVIDDMKAKQTELVQKLTNQ